MSPTTTTFILLSIGEVSGDLARVALAAPALNTALQPLAISVETTNIEDLKMELSVETALEPRQAVNTVLRPVVAVFLELQVANTVLPHVAAISVEFPAAIMALLLVAVAMLVFPAANTVLLLNNTMLPLNNTVPHQLLLLTPLQLNTVLPTKEGEEATLEETDTLETNMM